MTEIDRYGYPVERVRPERPAPPPTMTAAEIEEVVKLVIAYTRREPDTALVQVWAAQSVLGRWTFEEATKAIHLWGANRGPNDFLEPSDVTRSIRADRQDRALRAEQARLEANPGDAAAAERIQQIIGELAQHMGWSEEGQDRAGFALRVRCPHCGAAEGARCVSPTTGKALTHSPCHPSRTEALGRYLRDAS